MSKQLREDVTLEQLSLTRVQKQLDEGAIQPSAYMSLPDIKKLYVRKVLFERKSSSVAAKFIAEKVNKLSDFQYDAVDLEIEYRMDPAIQSAIREITLVKDMEFSAILQDKSRLAIDVTTNIMLNSENEELKLKAADSILRAGMSDLNSKRSKAGIEIKQSKTSTTINWNIQVADKEIVLPDQSYLDATIQDFDKTTGKKKDSMILEADDSMTIPPEEEFIMEEKDPWDPEVMELNEKAEV